MDDSESRLFESSADDCDTSGADVLICSSSGSEQAQLGSHFYSSRLAMSTNETSPLLQSTANIHGDVEAVVKDAHEADACELVTVPRIFLDLLKGAAFLAVDGEEFDNVPRAKRQLGLSTLF